MLTDRLSARQRHMREAVARAEEGVAFRRQLAAADPGAHLAGLAKALGNLGSLQADLGRHRGALASTDEALGMFRQLTDKQPEAHRLDLAWCLIRFGDARVRAGRDLGRALAAANEAAQLYEAESHEGQDDFADEMRQAKAVAAGILDARRDNRQADQLRQAAGLSKGPRWAQVVLATPYWLFVGTLAFVVDLISGHSLSHAASSGLDVAVLGFFVWQLVKLIMRYRQR